MRALIALATLVLLSGQAAAEMVDHIKTEYEPLVNTEAGRIDSCGIIFASAVRTLAGRLLIVKGSVSSTFWKENLPGVLVKLTVWDFKGQADPVPLKVYYASMRVKDLDTRPMRQVEGENGGMLLGGDLAKHEKLTLDFPTMFMSGAWVSFSLDTKIRDYNFRLPAFGEGNDGTFREYMQCAQLSLEEKVNEMEALARTIK
jgi:hypothetical protein